MVWCGTILGFDTDDSSIFDLHRQFIQQSRVPQAIVQMLYAIPQTPLHKRLAREGRLRESFLMSNWGAAAASNVVPLRLTQEALRQGYLKLMRELYEPDAYFARLDAVLLDTKWLPAIGRTRHMLANRRYWPWLKTRSWAAVEAAYIFVQLMRGVSDAGLRREYRRRVWRAILRRPNPRLVRIYCMLSAAHFHYTRLVQQLTEARPFVAAVPGGGRDSLVPTEELGRAAAD